MNEKITVEVSLTPKDVYEYRKAFIFSSSFVAGMLIPYGFFILALIAYTVLELVTKGNAMYALIFIAPAALIAAAAFAPLFLKKLSAKQYENSPFFREPQRFEFDEETVNVTSDTGNINTMWLDLYHAFEGKEAFYIYYAENQAYIIPKRYFNEEKDDIDKLRTLLANAPLPKGENKSFFKKLFFSGFGIIILLGIIAALLMIYWSYDPWIG